MMAKKGINIERYIGIICFVMVTMGATFFCANEYYQAAINKDKAQRLIDPQYLVTMMNGGLNDKEQWVSTILVHAYDAQSAYDLARQEVKASNNPNELSRIITIERVA